MPAIFVILLLFHFEISGKVVNDEQPLKIKLISITLFVFHFQISGKEVKDKHLKNK